MNVPTATELEEQIAAGRRRWEFRCPVKVKATSRLARHVVETFRESAGEELLPRLVLKRTLGLVAVELID